MTKSGPLMLDCGIHGERISTVVCKHMLRGEHAPAGFIENSSDPDDLQAWCQQCEDEFERQNGMTEAFRQFNGMTLVCLLCYTEAKSRHVGLEKEPATK
jgi:hypothetical protein